jgi:hypothetical protein
MQNVEQTILSQFANSPTLTQLIANMNAYIDPRADLLAFYDNVWNIDTAQGFGLDIWGRIVGISRVIPIPGTTGSFGFDNADTPPDWQNFGSINDPGAGGPFYSGEVSTGSFTLNDDAYRTLILAKALANIAATTAPGMNQLVQNLFPGRGRAYTIDNRDMSMTYVFEFSLSSIEFAILSFSGVLPHPGGVLTNITVAPVDTGFFGFAEMGAGVQPFGFGVFAG